MNIKPSSFNLLKDITSNSITEGNFFSNLMKKKEPEPAPKEETPEQPADIDINLLLLWANNLLKSPSGTRRIVLHLDYAVFQKTYMVTGGETELAKLLTDEQIASFAAKPDKLFRSSYLDIQLMKSKFTFTEMVGTANNREPILVLLNVPESDVDAFQQAGGSNGAAGLRDAFIKILNRKCYKMALHAQGAIDISQEVDTNWASGNNSAVTDLLSPKILAGLPKQGEIKTLYREYEYIHKKEGAEFGLLKKTEKTKADLESNNDLDDESTEPKEKTLEKPNAQIGALLAAMASSKDTYQQNALNDFIEAIKGMDINSSNYKAEITNLAKKLQGE